MQDDDDDESENESFQSRQRNALKNIEQEKSSQPENNIANRILANSIYDCKNEEQLMKFYHATCNSPVNPHGSRQSEINSSEDGQV